jgi:hypothetical protein
MNVRNRIIAIVLLTVAVASCFAQGGGGGRQGRGRNVGLIGLLARKDVQTDLALTSDQISKLDELRQSMRGQRGQGGAGAGAGGGAAAGGGANADPAARAAAQAERDKPVLAILTDVQQKRVKEIQIQIAGDTAVLMPDVQTSLNLTDDQKSKIKDLQQKQMEANRALAEKLRNQEIDRAAATEARQKNTQTLKDEIHKILTPDQVTKLKDLGGKPFVQETNGGGL